MKKLLAGIIACLMLLISPSTANARSINTYTTTTDNGLGTDTDTHGWINSFSKRGYKLYINGGIRKNGHRRVERTYLFVLTPKTKVYYQRVETKKVVRKNLSYIVPRMRKMYGDTLTIKVSHGKVISVKFFDWDPPLN